MTQYSINPARLQNNNKLDNPVWHSLDETHKEFSLTFGNLKCYRPGYCPFGGYEDNDIVSNHLDEYAKLIGNFYIVGEKPEFSQQLTLKKELVCWQMVIEHKIDVTINEGIIKLNNTHDKELFELVNLVQPGYFQSRTMLLGDYYGIFKNNALVAVTGERMKMNGFTEVSAVVTHPGHVGQGYAKQLIAHTVSKIFDENRIPYLHVAETNTGPVQLYDKLGFATRRKLSFWNFQSNSFTT